MIELKPPENAMRQKGSKGKFHLEKRDDGRSNKFTICNQILWANLPTTGIEWKPVQFLEPDELCRKCWPFIILEQL